MKRERADKRKDFVAWDREFVWHPFTQMAEYVEEEPIVVERGRGSYLYDVNGNRYLDGVSSLWCNVFGHSDKRIRKAITRQLEQLPHSTLLGVTHVPAILLAKRLVEIAPAGLTKVFFSDNGSTAVEVALKMAFQYWQHAEGKRSSRTRFVSLTNAYHGDTIGAVSLGGIDVFHEAFRPLLFRTLHAPSPHCYRCPLNLNPNLCAMKCADELAKIVSEHRDEIAAVVIEPIVQGAGGMIVHPPGYLSRVRDICSEHDVLLILDEVATGFGRTGRMFACQHENVTPDFLCLSKGLTGGYLPMAATITTDRVYKAFLGEVSELKTFFHGHTYTGNPLAASASLATLDRFEQKRVLQKLSTQIRRLEHGLNRLRDLQHVGDIRQRGLMAGVELVKDKETKESFPLDQRIGHRVCRKARDHGVLIRPLGDTIVLMPPLSITKKQIDHLVSATKTAIRSVTDDT